MNDVKIKQTDNVLEKSRAVFIPEVLQYIDNCLQHENPHSYLIAVLHKVQEHYGFLSRECLEAIAQIMQIPAAKVSGVASFYHYFRLKPSGKYVISVCTGTACYVKGAEALIKKLKTILNIKDCGETSEDGLFTLETTRCIGTCALAPIVKINDDVHLRVSDTELAEIIAGYRSKISKK